METTATKITTTTTILMATSTATTLMATSTATARQCSPYPSGPSGGVRTRSQKRRECKISIVLARALVTPLYLRLVAKDALLNMRSNQVTHLQQYAVTAEYANIADEAAPSGDNPTLYDRPPTKESAVVEGSSGFATSSRCRLMCSHTVPPVSPHRTHFELQYKRIAAFVRMQRVKSAIQLFKR